ncbi:MAG: HAMP domain-containing histidine kinase [Clostridiales bacterium]|nr:HAMP domain-containing histidine kinase [Clostridiales bacterium]
MADKKEKTVEKASSAQSSYAQQALPGGKPNGSKKLFGGNIFAKYFMMFSAILLIILTVLGTTLTFLVSAYNQNEKTQLLMENTQSIADSVSSNLIAQDMNDSYSVEKALICESLRVISSSIDSDVFVCDVEGNIILCKERAGSLPFFGNFSECSFHTNYYIGDNILQKVYESSYSGKGEVNGEESYIVGYPIYSGNEIIGSVFATTEANTYTITFAILRMFLLSTLLCLVLGFVCIWRLTRNFVQPLREMSAATKQFAIGDFSYRVKVEGDDELAELGMAFNEMADALDSLESSRNSFISNVSHELRTPMTSIGGFIDGILDGTIPKEKSDYYLKTVSDEIKRLTRLVVTMLNMSKMESGSFEMQPQNYDISDQIIHILLTFEQKIDEKNIEILGLEKLVPTHITADRDMVYQVIYNIFDNAVKFTNEGGYIQVTLNDFKDNIEIHIKNSGIGIKADELSKVFERFYKVDKSRGLDAKGAGLGLYIVKMVVEMHGGSIYARSDDETTAEFVFTLPKAYNPIYKKEKK